MYKVYDPDGNLILTWSYQIVRVWEVPADELIDTGRPFVMVLVGLSKITDPLRQLPAVLEIINTVEDPVTRERLKTVFYACIESEEIIDVLKELIKEKDEYDLDTAGIRWILKEHDERVVQKLRAEYAEEIAQLKQQAEQTRAQLEQQAEQRQRETLCTNIITVLQSRFAADDTTYAIIRRLLATETDPERLQALFNAGVTIGSLADFQNMVVSPQANGSV
ncbi:MAG: SMC-Scp complex subunit ScpB [Chloroflexaceae bacterium]|nr:SMC-Scp complex subunit ScpB [Chloroflexaceae bacterium]